MDTVRKFKKRDLLILVIIAAALAIFAAVFYTREKPEGGTVTVTVDRPLGSYHPEHKDMYYLINYGYVEGIMAPDGEEQDAYILGVDEAIEKFTGKIIAIIHRNDDVEEKWVVAPEGMTFTKEEIREQIHFQEQYFDSEIVM